jgi:hypothetical protein
MVHSKESRQDARDRAFSSDAMSTGLWRWAMCAVYLVCNTAPSAYAVRRGGAGAPAQPASAGPSAASAATMARDTTSGACADRQTGSTKPRGHWSIQLSLTHQQTTACNQTQIDVIRIVDHGAALQAQEREAGRAARSHRAGPHKWTQFGERTLIAPTEHVSDVASRRGE